MGLCVCAYVKLFTFALCAVWQSPPPSPLLLLFLSHSLSPSKTHSIWLANGWTLCQTRFTICIHIFWRWLISCLGGWRVCFWWCPSSAPIPVHKRRAAIDAYIALGQTVQSIAITNTEAKQRFNPNGACSTPPFTSQTPHLFPVCLVCLS